MVGLQRQRGWLSFINPNKACNVTARGPIVGGARGNFGCLCKYVQARPENAKNGQRSARAGGDRGAEIRVERRQRLDHPTLTADSRMILSNFQFQICTRTRTHATRCCCKCKRPTQTTTSTWRSSHVLGHCSVTTTITIIVIARSQLKAMYFKKWGSGSMRQDVVSRPVVSTSKNVRGCPCQDEDIATPARMHTLWHPCTHTRTPFSPSSGNS